MVTTLNYRKDQVRLISKLQTVAMADLAGCQHWTVHALPTYISISHSQLAVVSIPELTGSQEIDMLSRDQTMGCGLVDYFCSFFFIRCGVAFTIFLNK